MNNLKLQQALTTDYQKQWELGKKQYELGYISLQALQQYEQNYYTAKTQIPVLENNIVKSQNALKVLINENPGKVVTKQDFMALDSNGIIPANLPSKVLENRPDVRQAEETLIADNASIGYARANFFPSIQLTSNIGATSNVLSGLFSTGALGYNLNPDVLIPIFNLSYLGNIKQARGQYYADYYAYIKTIRNAFKDVDNGLSAHDKLTESFKTQELNYSSAKTAYTLADARYQDGADSYVTALTTKIKMENAAVLLSNSKLDQLNSVVGLYQALAGGYNVDNTDKPNKFGDGHDS
jgi:outer membrane protein, multidrug efflux system